MVRRMLLVRCPSVTLVYCGQMVGWIKMPLGTEVGRGQGDIVSDGDPAPSKGAQPPNFWPISNLIRLHVYHTERPPLFAAHLP